MPPNSANSEPLLHDEVKEEQLEKLVAPQAGPRKFQIVYPNLITFGYGHISLLYGAYLMFTFAKWQTIVFAHVMIILSGFGITAGAHRLWAHRTYKAKMPLQILLMLLNTLAFQNTAMDWVRDHRLHHKYSDTDADPHNATRGFFYSHVGWLLVRKHKEVKRRGKLIDLSDIENNPVLSFQKKYAIPLVSLVTFVMPTVIPMYFWGENLTNAWHVATLYRYVFVLNATFLVNSAAHYWGYKPYEKSILPSQNHFVSLFALGEGFHNYHHVFPWDYRTAELGNNTLNPTTKFIDFFAWIGWAYDLKAVPEDMINNRKSRTGDGSSLWGWGDKDQPKEEMNAAIIKYPDENDKDK
uniref:Fatty-acyl CoA Z/E11-desaturase n=1 Tax=Yponomeuta evonymella TaxID=2567737 RepID=E3UYX7_YPOEV|nr:fatty-acyl CoA Z/E11-desaturase [Yponomeuta evonymella]